MLNSVVVKVNGVDKTVKAEVINKKIWFKIDDQVFAFDLIDLVSNYGKSSKKSGASADKIVALMPGKITKIFVSNKQKVNKGDALLVMEAMKMEYTFKADISATVEGINCKSGDQVSLGQVLIKLTEDKQ